MRSPFLTGEVTDRDPATARVKVLFPSLDNLPSWWLPVLFTKTLSDQVVWLPDIGEHVACLVDEHAEAGVVLGAMYSDPAPPPSTNPDVAHVTFQDGTTIEYDRAAHQLTVTVVAGDVTINVPDGHKVTLGGAGADELVTKGFIATVFDAHEHPTPAGLSGIPVAIPGRSAWPNVTERAVGR